MSNNFKKVLCGYNLPEFIYLYIRQRATKEDVSMSAIAEELITKAIISEESK